MSVERKFEILTTNFLEIQILWDEDDTLIRNVWNFLRNTQHNIQEDFNLQCFADFQIHIKLCDC
jgi:hypothetical protein